MSWNRRSCLSRFRLLFLIQFIRENPRSTIALEIGRVRATMKTSSNFWYRSLIQPPKIPGEKFPPPKSRGKILASGPITDTSVIKPLPFVIKVVLVHSSVNVQHVLLFFAIVGSNYPIISLISIADHWKSLHIHENGTESVETSTAMHFSPSWVQLAYSRYWSLSLVIEDYYHSTTSARLLALDY